MRKNGAAHSSECRIFETKEFRKALFMIGPPALSARETGRICLSPGEAGTALRTER